MPRKRLRIFQHPACDIRLLLVDLSLPTMGGAELAKSLLAQKSDLDVVFISGHTHDVAIDFSLPNIDYLPKPVSPQELLEKVHGMFSRQ
ncbi:MAG: response regulator [Gammaproteobacteria bacterium]|nr:response regulator [Gammaproteobacteria bacterium]